MWNQHEVQGLSRSDNLVEWTENGILPSSIYSIPYSWNFAIIMFLYSFIHVIKSEIDRTLIIIILDNWFDTLGTI